MKRIIVLLMALLTAYALAGCNMAPNVPRTTPYVTKGTENYNYSGTTTPYVTNKAGTYNAGTYNAGTYKAKTYNEKTYDAGTYSISPGMFEKGMR